MLFARWLYTSQESMIKKNPAINPLGWVLFFALGSSTLLDLCAQEEQPGYEQCVEASAREENKTPVTANTSAPRTVAELGARIRDVLARPELAPAHVAIQVASLETGRILFEQNAVKLLQPASVMKAYTVAAALDRLTPDFRFRTSVYAKRRPDATGTIHGDLTIYGRGDPSIAARFHHGDYQQGIDALASRIQAAGVQRIEGDLVGDDRYFTGAPFGFGWEWADLQWYGGAEVSALSVNDNALDLLIKPGPSVGAPCTITTGPPMPLIQFANRATTTARGTERAVSVYRDLGGRVIEIGGSLPLDDPGWTGIISVSRPARVFVHMLRAALARRGVTITGRSRAVERSERAGAPLDPTSLTEIASMQSPPLREIAARTLKSSQNLYAELILRALGTVGRADATQTSEEAGLAVVRDFLREAGVDPRRLVLTDGSGLSRRDLVTAESMLKLFTYMDRHRFAAAFREALPVAGVDGTLRTRMKGTVAAHNVRAKTGSLPAVAALSGYVTSATGEHLVFSIVINNHAEESTARRSPIDDIAVLLAAFTGRSDP